MGSFQTINPATEEVLGEYYYLTEQEIRYALKKATMEFADWRQTSLTKRIGLLHQLASQLRQQQESLATLITKEMGKPITQARAEIEKCAVGCEYYAEHAERFLAPLPVETSASESYLRFDPIGAVLAIMPWNFPFWQVFRFAIPTLLVGNVAILKHAANVTECGREIENLFRSVGLPEGAFQSLVVSHEHVPLLLDDPIVQAVTLTGSETAGRKVAAMAGERLKKSVLELGGSDPFIVLADADLDSTVKQAVRARTLNTGQSCIAAKRFIVEQPILNAFTEAFVEEMRSLKVGNPLEGDTRLGPLAREEFLIELNDQAKKSVHLGAKHLLGGERIDRPGYFYEPTVLGDVGPDMPAFEEETFGPLAAIVPAKDEVEALKLAVHTDYGLGASIWTKDIDRAKLMAGQIPAGSVFINEVTGSDPRVPFGGVKRSGYGRELALEGIREFVNVKTVWIG